MLTRYQELNHLYVNAAAVKRIAGVPMSRKVEFRDVSPTAVVVHVEKLGQITITQTQFEQHFEALRREGAKAVIARPVGQSHYGDRYEVTGTKGDLYHVEVSDHAIACSCEDWSQHETVCKHGYAVLDLLGLTTFEQYQQARTKVVALPVGMPSRAAASPIREIAGRLTVRGVGIE